MELRKGVQVKIGAAALLGLCLFGYVIVALLSEKQFAPAVSKEQKVLFGPCSRTGALLDQYGKPCRDLKKAMYDQRICAAREKGANYYCCVPPKNGSSYHKGVIFRIFGDKRYYSIGHVHGTEALKNKMRLDNHTNEEIRDMLTDPTMHKYAIVRNPVLRVLSGYLNIKKRVPDAEKTEEKFQEWAWQQYPRGWTSTTNRRQMNAHVRSQIEFCGFRYPDVYKQYKLFRFEEPELYVDYMYEIIPREFLDSGWGVKRNMSFRDATLAPRSRTHDTEAKFVRYVGSLELYDHLVDVFKGDIDLFGYRKDVEELRKEFTS